MTQHVLLWRDVHLQWIAQVPKILNVNLVYPDFIFPTVSPTRAYVSPKKKLRNNFQKRVFRSKVVFHKSRVTTRGHLRAVNATTDIPSYPPQASQTSVNWTKIVNTMSGARGARASTAKEVLIIESAKYRRTTLRCSNTAGASWLREWNVVSRAVSFFVPGNFS